MTTNKMTSLILHIGLLLSFILFFNVSSFCQLKDSTIKILVAENTGLAAITRPQKKYFYKGSIIKIIRYSNDTILRGRLNSITDSTILIKHSSVYIKDIKKINIQRWGTVASISGATVTIISALLAYHFAQPYETSPITGEEYSNDFGAMMAGATAFIGGIVTICGVIDLISTKTYKPDKNYKLYVLTKNRKI